jgi:hypothetical protein
MTCNVCVCVCVCVCVKRHASNDISVVHLTLDGVNGK